MGLEATVYNNGQPGYEGADMIRAKCSLIVTSRPFSQALESRGIPRGNKTKAFEKKHAKMLM